MAGAVYFDSGPEGSSIAIDTQFGTVRNVGTRFEVRLGGGGRDVTLRVRQGRVALDAASGSVAVGEGEEVILSRDGSVTRGPLASTAAEWAWIQEITPGFELEGARLSSFLDWVSAESGLSVRYEDAELAESAQQIQFQLHGEIEGLTPTQAVEAVMPSSGLSYRVAGGELYVSRPAG